MVKILFIVALTILFYSSSMNVSVGETSYFKNPNEVLFEKYDVTTKKIILNNENQLVIQERKDETKQNSTTNSK